MSSRTPFHSHGARSVAPLALLALASLAPAAFADGTPATAITPVVQPAPAAIVKSPEATETAPTPVRPPVARPNPMFTAMMAVFDDGQRQVEALEARLAKTTDHRQAVELEREVARVRVQTEVGMLRVQSEYARRAGRAQLADRIDAVIHEILSPTPLPAPEVARPAPGTDAAPQR